MTRIFISVPRRAPERRGGHEDKRRRSGIRETRRNKQTRCGGREGRREYVCETVESNEHRRINVYK